MNFNKGLILYRPIVLSSAFALLTLSMSGCGKAPAPAGGGSGTKAASLPEVKVEIQANDQMKFDLTSISVKPGQKVSITLRNVGTMPKVSMGHNLVVLTQSTDPVKFIEASQTHMANDYIAPEMRSNVIAHTKLLGPGESETIVFTAPRTPGSYPYVCSFPGHYAIGMKGSLEVR